MSFRCIKRIWKFYCISTQLSCVWSARKCQQRPCETFTSETSILSFLKHLQINLHTNKFKILQKIFTATWPFEIRCSFCVAEDFWKLGAVSVSRSFYSRSTVVFKDILEIVGYMHIVVCNYDLLTHIMFSEKRFNLWDKNFHFGQVNTTVYLEAENKQRAKAKRKLRR